MLTGRALSGITIQYKPVVANGGDYAAPTTCSYVTRCTYVLPECASQGWPESQPFMVYGHNTHYCYSCCEQVRIQY